jgi:integrase
MIKRILTDRAIKALKPAPAGKRLLRADGLVPNLYLRITDKGRKSFCLITRYPGSRHPAPRTLGEYGAISLEQAREKARVWLALLAKGVDPAIQEARERAAEAARQADTVAAALELFIERHLAGLRTGHDVTVALRRLLKPWALRPISSITRKDVKDVVFGIHDGGAPIAANRALAYIKKFFAWAVERDLIDASPAALVKRPAKERSRERVLSDAEIKAVWVACRSLGHFGRCIRFMLATGQRRGECSGAVWTTEIDTSAPVWRLPAGRVKANRAHELPLNNLALECLGKPNGDSYIFGGLKPVTSWSTSTAALRRLVAEQLPDAVPDWHLHDLRRSVATSMARLGIDRIVISRILNHADSGVTARYDRYGRDIEMVEAMERWDRRLREIIDGGKSADVVELRGRRP